MPPKRLTKAKKAGRPPTLTMPEPIPDTIDNVMDAVLTTPPKKRGEWKYMQRRNRKQPQAKWPSAPVV